MALCRRPPTRFWIGVMIFFGTYINFATRTNLSISIISMTKTKKTFTPECKPNASTENTQEAFDEQYPDYGPREDWSQGVQGLVLAGYFYGYVFSCLPSGPIAEWLGPFPLIFWGTLITAVLNALCVPAAWLHYWALIVIRFCIGVLGSFFYPAFQVLIAKWAPPIEKGKFTAGLMGNGLATVLNWPLISTITIHFGWDWGFYSISLILVLYSLIFWFVVTDTPEQHKCISDEEIEYIKESQGGSVTKKKHAPPYKAIFKSIPFWALAFSHFGSLWGLYLQLNSIPKYMVEVIGYDLQKAGAFAMLPHLSRMCVGAAVGAIGDWLQKKGIVTSKGLRKTFCFFSHIVPGILIIGIAFCGCNTAAIIFLLVASLGSNGTSVLTNLLNQQDLAPNFSATLFGIASFLGNITGFIVPKVTGACIQENNGIKEWGLNFYIGGVMYLVSGVVFILFASVEEQEWNRIADREKPA